MKVLALGGSGNMGQTAVKTMLGSREAHARTAQALTNLEYKQVDGL